MDRREALKSFLSLPAAATIERHKLESGDVAILRFDQPLPAERFARIQELWKELLPEIPLIILEPGTKLEFARRPL